MGPSSVGLCDALENSEKETGHKRQGVGLAMELVESALDVAAVVEEVHTMNRETTADGDRPHQRKTCPFSALTLIETFQRFSQRFNLNWALL